MTQFLTAIKDVKHGEVLLPYKVNQYPMMGN